MQQTVTGSDGAALPDGAPPCGEHIPVTDSAHFAESITPPMGAQLATVGSTDVISELQLVSLKRVTSPLHPTLVGAAHPHGLQARESLAVL
jgi:hypothetical protein